MFLQRVHLTRTVGSPRSGKAFTNLVLLFSISPCPILCPQVRWTLWVCGEMLQSTHDHSKFVYPLFFLKYLPHHVSDPSLTTTSNYGNKKEIKIEKTGSANLPTHLLILYYLLTLGESLHIARTLHLLFSFSFLLFTFSLLFLFQGQVLSLLGLLLGGDFTNNGGKGGKLQAVFSLVEAKTRIKVDKKCSLVHGDSAGPLRGTVKVGC
mmetsp:Transcript_11174/g.29411  ORF Transcript_11174/g.29411 Transcript_11174/m.29411 type:complete len:208 (+) Transcript_11174:954-1577(+)